MQGIQILIRENEGQAEATRQREAHAALARIGQELVASFNTPTMLDRLCQLTADALACDYSYTVLWHPQEEGYMPVARWGILPEEWEALCQLSVSKEQLTPLLAQLATDDVLTTTPFPAFPPGAGISRGKAPQLYAALRRGNDIIGLQVACYRNQSSLFTLQQESLAQGIAHLTSLALENVRLREQVESANRLKSDLLDMMSHELRTPLHIITGYVQLFLEGSFGLPTPEQTDVMQRVERSACNLLDLITGVLDIRRLDAGLLSVEVTEIQVAELMADLQHKLAAEWAKPTLQVTWQVAPDLPLLYTDRAKLKIILSNLIRNALKFTDEGRVTVTARQHGEGVSFRVSDTGIGIAPSTLSSLFEPFHKGDMSPTQRHGGVGLGLYIVRRLLELLAGSISVNSEVGRGSTFHVWIPRAVMKT